MKKLKEILECLECLAVLFSPVIIFTILGLLGIKI
jgi:hypothetical protein